MKKIFIKLIVLYQKTLSPDHGFFKFFYPWGYCRFYPSCSEYCRQSLQKYNLFKALARCVWRLLRCHPFSKGGYDQA